MTCDDNVDGDKRQPSAQAVRIAHPLYWRPAPQHSAPGSLLRALSVASLQWLQCMRQRSVACALVCVRATIIIIAALTTVVAVSRSAPSQWSGSRVLAWVRPVDGGRLSASRRAGGTASPLLPLPHRHHHLPSPDCTRARLGTQSESTEHADSPSEDVGMSRKSRTRRRLA